MRICRERRCNSKEIWRWNPGRRCICLHVVRSSDISLPEEREEREEREQDRKGASFLVVGSILRQYMYLGEQKTRMDTSDSTELVFTCTVRY